MIQKKQNKLISIFVFVAICIILFTIPLMDAQGERLMWDHRTFNAWIRTAMFISLFLLNTYIFVPKLLFKGERTLFIVVAIISVALLALAWEVFMPIFEGQEVFRPEFPPNGRPDFGPPILEPGLRPRPPQPGPPKSMMIINNSLISLLVIGLSIALKVTHKWLKDEQKLKEIERESLESELAFLKNQISPHFFLNTLNNIHALIDIDKKDSQKAIIELSGMMRYLLYESEKGESSLQKEIDFIQNYIDLMQLRIDEKVELKIDLPQKVSDISIPPLLFISFLENAFKHGVSYTDKSFIHLSLKQTESHIEFSCSNSVNIHNGEIEEDSGIGLNNIKKRLELLYGKEYSLNIVTAENVFHVNLKLPIQ